MLSKNWQQKADGSAVNWAEVHVIIFLSHFASLTALSSLAGRLINLQVPNGDADYDDGGD
jgi:hypothetical protein